MSACVCEGKGHVCMYERNVTRITVDRLNTSCMCTQNTCAFIHNSMLI